MTFWAVFFFYFYFSLLDHYLKYSSFDFPVEHVLWVGRQNLSNKDPWSHTKGSCLRITQAIPSTNTSTEADLDHDISFRNSSAVAFYMGMVVYMDVSGVIPIHCTINTTGIKAFAFVERKIPTTAA